MTLVALDPGCCPRCATALEQVAWLEPALLRHGGYGATRRTVKRICPRCGWSIIGERSEAKP